MGLDEPSLYDDDEQLSRTLLARSPVACGITYERLEARWVRLDYPRAVRAVHRRLPDAVGRLEFVSARAQADGHDPLPGYTPPHERLAPDDLAEYPLALIAPASHWFLNSTFANHPACASAREARGSSCTPTTPPLAASHRRRGSRLQRPRRVLAGSRSRDRVRPGVIASTKGHWLKHLRGGANVNATVEERDADMGGGAVFHDNRVEVERL